MMDKLKIQNYSGILVWGVAEAALRDWETALNFPRHPQKYFQEAPRRFQDQILVGFLETSGHQQRIKNPYQLWKRKTNQTLAG